MSETLALSAAIRIGAEKRPQGFEGYVVRSDDEPCTCVIGAGFEGYTGKLPATSNMLSLGTDDYEFVQLIGNRCDRQCPACSETLFDLKHAGVHLNDDHRWPRERIADWLESLGY